jgi:hypothetical protein
MGPKKAKATSFTSPHSLHKGINLGMTLKNTFLASSTLIILFSENVEIIFKNYFFQIKKKIVKENSEYLRIFHLLK